MYGRLRSPQDDAGELIGSAPALPEVLVRQAKTRAGVVSPRKLELCFDNGFVPCDMLAAACFKTRDRTGLRTAKPQLSTRVLIHALQSCNACDLRRTAAVMRLASRRAQVHVALHKRWKRPFGKVG